MNAAIGLVLADFGPRRGRFGGRHIGVVFLGLVLVAAVVVLAILLYRTRNSAHRVALQSSAPTYPPMPFVPNTASASPAAPQIGNAEAILAERLARGEISVDDYTAARRALLGQPASTGGGVTE